MDRSRFFAALRSRGSGVFGTSISQKQVEGTELILDEAQRRGTRTNDLAYMLATAYHETAHTMQPIREYGRGKGRKYGAAAGKYGHVYYGRGLVQLTWLFNYEKASAKLGVDFVKYPDRVMEPKLAVAIMFDGMNEGWFTGKAVDDFIDGKDEDDAEDRREFAGARKIINGTDKANLIAGYALAFEKALREAGYVSQAPKPRPVPPAAAPTPIPAPKPIPVPPPRKPAPAPVQRPRGPAALIALVITVLAGLGAWLASLPCAVLGIFCGG